MPFCGFGGGAGKPDGPGAGFGVCTDGMATGGGAGTTDLQLVHVGFGGGATCLLLVDGVTTGGGAGANFDGFDFLTEEVEQSDVTSTKLVETVGLAHVACGRGLRDGFGCTMDVEPLSHETVTYWVLE